MNGSHPIGLEAVALLHVLQAEPHIHVVETEAEAEEMTAFLRGARPDLRIDHFPAWDCLPFDSASPTSDVMGRRMAVLHRMREGRTDLVVTALPVLLQRVPPADAVRNITVTVGQALDIDTLRAFLQDAGYRDDERVDEPGEVAFRGLTLEIFTGEGPPCRIEVSDGVVTALRLYDPATQRSTGELKVLEIAPVTELPAREEGHARGAEHRLSEMWDSLVLLPHHMGGARLTARPGTRKRGDDVLARLRDMHREAQDDGAHPMDAAALYLAPEEWEALALTLVELALPEWKAVPNFAATSRPRQQMAQFLESDEVGDRPIVFIAGSKADGVRIGRMVAQAIGAPPEPANDWDGCKTQPRSILIAHLAEGFVTEDLVVLTARDLLGSRAEAARAYPETAPNPIFVDGFELGDLVVHEDHGIARLQGLEPLDADGSGGEMIRLVFDKDERLMVPTHEAGRIWRYGSADAGVTLDRLRGKAWATRRDKTRDALAALAGRLAELTRTRSAAEAIKLAPPARDYERFIARFPHPLTADQAAAVRDVLENLASGRPMDRLVIGDVGFGKTEVALRAAAAAALAGRQVALCAPTTVLARQHYDTFRRRFAPLGIEVGHLSRLVTGKAASTVRAGLKSGSIRVVVGTHALIGKEVEFADLGLLILDEEQRFGIAQKDKLRALGRGIHVLSMSATPIPRTLQSALVGLQDLSVIATPPARRRAIRTQILEDDDAALRQALLREKRRGGQSFVVVPRIDDIAGVTERLARVVPDLQVRVAHGDLKAAEIDMTMVSFAAGEGDVLLATGIIESGLDVARANTMVILHPELFGLAQLHQLRGRVGRGAVQAYCHLVPADAGGLAEDARKRLDTLQMLDRLGAGMAVSAADLDSRGAGDLLGDRQAGHMKRIGMGLYREMLTQALVRVRGEDEPPPMPEVPGEPGHIPSDYVPEPETRMGLYHRIARAVCLDEVEQLAEEVADRFGPPPDATEMLLQSARLRALAAAAGVRRLTLGPQGVMLELQDGHPLNGARPLIEPLEGLTIGEGRITRRVTGSNDSLHLAMDLMERLN